MTTEKSIERFNRVGNNLITAVTNGVVQQGFNATGESIESLRFSWDGKSFILFGDESFYFMQNGRGPGKFPPMSKIMKWLSAKSIVFSGISDKSAAFLIGRKMANEGSAVFRGEREGLKLGEIFTNKRELIVNTVLEDKNEEYTERLKSTVR